MRKFISPVLRKLIKVAILLFVFVVLLHSSRGDKNLGAESRALTGVTDTKGNCGYEALQVDEPAEPETGVAHSYVLPAIVIGGARLRF